MTNADIILTEMVLNKLDPEEVTVDTFAGWKRKGYSVKKGEKAVFQTKIWKPSKFTAKVDEAEATAGVEETDKAEAKTYKKLILVPASFFTDKQVEKVASR